MDQRFMLGRDGCAAGSEQRRRCQRDERTFPRFLDSDHLIAGREDAEAYLARLQSYATQLEGELG